MLCKPTFNEATTGRGVGFGIAALALLTCLRVVFFQALPVLNLQKHIGRTSEHIRPVLPPPLMILLPPPPRPCNWEGPQQCNLEIQTHASAPRPPPPPPPVGCSELPPPPPPRQACASVAVSSKRAPPLLSKPREFKASKQNSLSLSSHHDFLAVLLYQATRSRMIRKDHPSPPSCPSQPHPCPNNDVHPSCTR